jgi:hypothetical protein
MHDKRAPRATTPRSRSYTFGDSILDCGRYNAYGVHPGQLIVRNDDRLFPEFKGLDLSSSRVRLTCSPEIVRC